MDILRFKINLSMLKAMDKARESGKSRKQYLVLLHILLLEVLPEKIGILKVDVPDI